MESVCKITIDKMVNTLLKKYVEKNILEEYKLNDAGHNITHIEFVLERAFELSEAYNINYDMLYAVICFHDIACHVCNNKKLHKR